MKYPPWAPKKLIHHHEMRLSRATRPSFDEIAKSSPYPRLSDEAKAKLHATLNRALYLLPDEEADRLLEKLLTNDQMRKVWAAIDKRALSKDDPFKLFLACQRALVGWREEQKLTPLERKKFFMQIHEAALKLNGLMSQVRIFENYFPIQEISDEKIIRLLEDLKAAPPYEDMESNINYTKSCLGDVVPAFRELLLDVSIKALSYSNLDPLVRKPNSKDAALHYFVRYMNAAFRGHYAQPLHEVVAILACVVFDRDDIDEGRVRKLIKE